MRNRTHDRLLALCLRVETLTQQFEELQQLRDRVRRAEAKTICVARYRQRTHRRSLRRHRRVGSLSKGH